MWKPVLLTVALLLFQLLYLVSPIDLIPDVLLLVGLMDDLLVLGGGFLLIGWVWWRALHVPRVIAEPVAYEPLTMDEIRAL